MVERPGELDASARDVGMRRARDGDRGVLGHALAGLLGAPAVDGHEAGENHRLGLLPRRREAPRHEQEIQPRLQNVIATFIEPSGSRARANASAARATGNRCETRSATRTSRRAIRSRASKVSSGPQE